MEKIRARLNVLRDHRWSSYRAYGRYAAAPEWLVTGELLRRAGGHEGYRRHVQQYVTGGLDPAEFEGLKDRVAVGSTPFLEAARSVVHRSSVEQPQRSFLHRRVPFERIMATVESEKGESWLEFRDRYGDWGCAMALYLARERSGLTLREIGELAGGLEYKNVSVCIRRFKQTLAKNRNLQRIARRCMERLSNVET